MAAGFAALLLLVFALAAAPAQLAELVSINGELVAGPATGSLVLVERYLIGNGSGHGEAILEFNNTMVVLAADMDYVFNTSSLPVEEGAELYIYTNGSIELRSGGGSGSAHVRVFYNTSGESYGGSSVISYELRRGEDESRLFLTIRRGVAYLGNESIEFSLDLVLVQNWAINYSWVDVDFNASSRNVEPLTRLYLWLKEILPEDAPKPRPPRPEAQGAFVLRYTGRIPLGSLAVPASPTFNMSLSIGPISVVPEKILRGKANYTIEAYANQTRISASTSLDMVFHGTVRASVNGAAARVEEGSSRLVLRGSSAEHRLSASIRPVSMADYVPVLVYVSEALTKSSGSFVVHGAGGVLVFDPVSGSVVPALTLTKDKPWAALVRAGIGYGFYQGNPAVAVLEEAEEGIVVPSWVTAGRVELQVLVPGKTVDRIMVELEAPVKVVRVLLGDSAVIVEGERGIGALCLGRVGAIELPENLEPLAIYNITVDPPQSLEISLPIQKAEENIVVLASIDGGQSWTQLEAYIKDEAVTVRAGEGELLLALAVKKSSPAQPPQQTPQESVSATASPQPGKTSKPSGQQPKGETLEREETTTPSPVAETGKEAEKARRDVSDVLAATVMVLVMVLVSAFIARKSA